MTEHDTRPDAVRLDLHARAQAVARAVSYVRAGGPLGDVTARRDRPTLTEWEAWDFTRDTASALDGLPVRRVAVLPEHDSTPVLLDGYGAAERRLRNREAAS